MININLLRLIDKLLILKIILTLPLKKLFINKNKKSKKVLVIRLWALGDCINTLPIMNKLNDKGYKVDVLTTKSFQTIFNHHSFVNKIVLFNFKNPLEFVRLFFYFKKQNYSIVIDTEEFLNISTLLGLLTRPKFFIGYDHKLRSKLYTNTVEYVEMEHFVVNFARLLEPLNIKTKFSKLIPMYYDKRSENNINQLIKSFKNKKLIVLHMGTGGTALGRRWNNINFLNLALKIQKNYHNVQIIFTGLGDEIELYDQIKDKLSGKELCFINKFSLNEFIYFFKKIDLFITNDTGPMHMAASMGTKVIGLFGMNDPNKVGPWPLNKNVSVYKNPNNNMIINNKYSVYPKDDQSTINLITVNDVFKEVNNILK